MPPQPVTPIRLVHHASGAPGLRWLGLGPDMRPSRALLKLQRLFDRHAFWARGRSFGQLKRLLAGSDAVISSGAASGWWAGRATSDGFSRAVLWDIVVAILPGPWPRPPGNRGASTHPTSGRGWSRVYLRTTKSAGFYGNWASRTQTPSS